MHYKKLLSGLSCTILLTGICPGQRIELQDDYLRLNAAGNDPVYTTYVAAPGRSQLYGDKAWRLVYWNAEQPLFNSPSNYSRDAITAKMLLDKYAATHEQTK
jgi:hypothetical protein